MEGVTGAAEIQGRRFCRCEGALTSALTRNRGFPSEPDPLSLLEWSAAINHCSMYRP